MARKRIENDVYANIFAVEMQIFLRFRGENGGILGFVGRGEAKEQLNKKCFYGETR